MTWHELKEFANSLSEEQLTKKVILWREDEAITSIDAECLEKNHFVEIGSEEDGCFDEDTMYEMIRSNSNYYQNKEKHFKKVYDKGHPILWEEF